MVNVYEVAVFHAEPNMEIPDDFPEYLWKVDQPDGSVIYAFSDINEALSAELSCKCGDFFNADH